jgi:hypothetical protein
MKSSRYLIGIPLVSLLAMVPALSQAENKLIVKDGSGNQKFVVTDQGYLGVGTSNPEKPIDVVGGAVISTQIRSRFTSDNSSGGGGVIVYHNRASQGPNNYLALNGDRLGYFYFGSATTTPDPNSGNLPYVLNSAGVAAYADANFTFSVDQNNLNPVRQMPSHFAFETASATSGNSRVERLRIGSKSADGTTQIAINSSTPQATLDVNGSFRINPGNALPPNGTAVSKPTCSDSIRGTFWFIQGAGQAKDTLQICVSNGTSTDWVNIY